jgi:hypothetical protein
MRRIPYWRTMILCRVISLKNNLNPEHKVSRHLKWGLVLKKCTSIAKEIKLESSNTI